MQTKEEFIKEQVSILENMNNLNVDIDLSIIIDDIRNLSDEDYVKFPSGEKTIQMPDPEYDEVLNFCNKYGISEEELDNMSIEECNELVRRNK